MKRIVKGFVLLLPIFALTGCIYNHKKDLVDEYQEYLKYSLGDYKVTSESNHSYADDSIPHREKYISWVIKFKTDDGIERILSLRNKDSFSDQIVGMGSSIVREQIEQDVVSKFSPQKAWNQTDPENEDYPYHVYVKSRQKTGVSDEAIEYRKRVTDLKTGLKLKTVTPQVLVQDWDVHFEVSLTDWDSDHETCLELKSDFDEMVRSIATYLGQDEVPYDFTCHFDDISVKGTYDRKTDTFSGKTRVERDHDFYYASDGLLRKYKKYLYNDMKLSFPGNSSCDYDEEEQQYYLNAYAIRDIFQDLGDEQSKDSRTYTWETGNGNYTLEYIESHRYTITKDKELYYTFKEIDKGLTLTEFEELTGTTIALDNEEQILTISK